MSTINNILIDMIDDQEDTEEEQLEDEEEELSRMKEMQYDWVSFEKEFEKE